MTQIVLATGGDLPAVSLAAVAVVATSDVASLSGPQTIDGVALVAGERVLLTAQSSGADNGVWVVHAGAWTRPTTDFASGIVVTSQPIVQVVGGTLGAGSSWLLTTTPVTVDTTPQTWQSQVPVSVVLDSQDLWQQPAPDPGTGVQPTINSAANVFNGTIDPSVYYGLNLKANGTLVQAGEPGMAFCLEQCYNDGTPDRKMEAYIDFCAADGVTIERPLFAQFDATTKRITAVALAGDQFTVTDGAHAHTVLAVTKDTFQINSWGGNGTGVNIKADAGGYSYLYMGHDGQDAVLYIAPESKTAVGISVGSFQPIFHLDSFPGGAPGSSVSTGGIAEVSHGLFVGVNTIPYNGFNTFGARAFAGQTGYVIGAQDSAGTPTWVIDTAGIPQWVAAGNQQTTVGAAGAASALPATPSKYLKVKDSAGATYVIPAYAAA